MIKGIFSCVACFALIMVTAPAGAAERIAQNKPASPASPVKGDCEAGIQKLENSQAEGEERLAEKNDAIDQCLSQYKQDKTITALVDECAKYVEQPVLNQQFVADCELAAFNYANALRDLKAEYGK